MSLLDPAAAAQNEVAALQAALKKANDQYGRLMAVHETTVGFLNDKWNAAQAEVTYRCIIMRLV